MDPYLSLVKASDTATERGVTPGYWHIKRDNPEDMASYYPLCGEDGEFVEPGSEHLEMTRRNRPEAKPENFNRMVRDGEAHLKRIEAEREAVREQRREEFAERLESKERAHVSMTGNWTNSVKGKKTKS
jgi:hypothetical protein